MEHIYSIHIHIEVDSTKHSYLLDRDFGSLSEAEEEVRDFFESVRS